MEHIIAIVALVLTGPLVGVELGVAAFTNPLVAKLPDEPYRMFRSGGSRLLGGLMPFWYIGSLVALIAGAVVTRDVLAMIAVAVMAVALLLTVTVRPHQQPDRCLALGSRCGPRPGQSMGPAALGAGGSARRDVRRADGWRDHLTHCRWPRACAECSRLAECRRADTHARR